MVENVMLHHNKLHNYLCKNTYNYLTITYTYNKNNIFYFYFNFILYIQRRHNINHKKYKKRIKLTIKKKLK